MMPAATRLFMMLKSANRITIRPAVLKNTPRLALLFMLYELKLMSVSTGRVPSANESMVRLPARKLPVVRE